MKTAKFYNNCVNWPRQALDQLEDIIDNSREITRQTFLRNVDREQLMCLKDILGYSRHHSQGLTMAKDWNVSYCKSPGGYYFFIHSAIEYIFVKEEEDSYDA